MNDHDADDLAEMASTTNLPLATVEGYAARGWFDREPGSGRFFLKDGIWRCSLIHHLETYWHFDEEEIAGTLRYNDHCGLARMGGGRVRQRYVPFEQELSKNGPVWICSPQGRVAPGRPVRFIVHGDIDGVALDWMLVRDDAVLLDEGSAQHFELLGRAYAVGSTRADLRPGRYHLHLGGCGSWPLSVNGDADLAFTEHMLRYFRGARCGEETEYHPACHQDDGIRNDTGEYIDLVGGWHDAGDFCHITSTTTAIYYLVKAREARGDELPSLVEEARRAVDYNLRARDQETGMVFENKGIGRGGEDGLSFPDNHRMTDNRRGSGDERHMRCSGQIQTAMDCLSCLAVGARLDAEQTEACREAAERSWAFHAGQEAQHIWQIAKRVICCCEWLQTSGDTAWAERMAPHAETLLAAVDDDGDVLDLDGSIAFEHYQHGAPFLALNLLAASDASQAARAEDLCSRCADRMLAMAALQPYGVTCFSIQKQEHTDRFHNQDTLNSWHELGGGKVYRQYQPFTDTFWMGSVSHLSLLGIGLALLARRRDRDDCMELAWKHFEWAMGVNPYQCCLVSGWGSCEAAPHSGAVGYMPGGTYQGPIGDQDDLPYFQTGMHMRIGEEPRYNVAGPAWAREYWSPLSGALLLLRQLLG